ncbi:hypothetical protein ACFFLM_05850 [Deinococcus oregonensis]|uniref:Uncharacterized protein n=1 Tax=Deinococcus oregonensis TaxID=1805970 RepID=A0ABV6AZ81_9DEIO
MLYGVLPTLQPQSFDFARTYAAYGSLFISRCDGGDQAEVSLCPPHPLAGR